MPVDSGNEAGLTTKDFLNPNSMLTPGIAGALAMAISNTLWVQFGLPASWTALVLSFLIGILVLSSVKAAALWQKGLYYFFNSLIIFSTAAGTQTLGGAVKEKIAFGPVESAIGRLGDSIFPSAYAQTGPGTAPSPKNEEEARRLRQEIQALQLQLQKAQAAQTQERAKAAISREAAKSVAQPATKSDEERKFFKPWF